VNEEGEIIGSHEGAIFFTLGERHGFTIFKNEDNSRPLYVVDKDIENNKIVVSHRSIYIRPNKEKNIILCNNTNWISNIPEKNRIYTSQIRYHGEYYNCKIEILENSKAKIIFDKNILVDKGQSVVVYDNDVCLGGCIVGK